MTGGTSLGEMDKNALKNKARVDEVRRKANLGVSKVNHVAVAQRGDDDKSEGGQHTHLRSRAEVLGFAQMRGMLFRQWLRGGNIMRQHLHLCGSQRQEISARRYALHCFLPPNRRCLFVI